MVPFRSKPLRVAALVMRMILGAFFIVSAISKLIGIDNFEIYIFTFNVLPLNLSFLAARLVIVMEMILGIGLIANVFNRLINVCSVLMLCCFTLFLGYAALIGRTDSCQCMGGLMEIDPIHSILKNALLMVVMLFAMGSRPWQWKPRWFVWLPVVLVPLVAVFVSSAPDNWMFGPEEEVFNQERLDSAISPEGDLSTLGLGEGRHVVAFLTPGCPFCRMADEKLTHICRRNELDSAAFVYLTPRSDSTVAALTMDTANFIRPSYLIDQKTWAYITYGQRPMIFLMDGGKVEATCHYRNINEGQIVDFIQQ